MAVVNYWAHLPFLRITEEIIPFGPGKLWRVPFEVWSFLTGGAYDEEQPSYEATAPVFLYCEVEVDWPFIVPGSLDRWRSAEMKKPTHEGDQRFEEMGFAFLIRFLQTYAWSAQAALNLACPAAGVGTPRHSVTFCVPDDSYFQLPTQTAGVARIQGDADHELVLLAEAAGRPLEPTQIQFASDLWPVADACRDNDVLGPALTALMTCSEPSLSDIDQMVLATVAIESLLLPEVRSDLKRTFTERLSGMLRSTQDSDEVGPAASALYEARSSALHGEWAGDADGYDRMARSGAAQQLLAAGILAMAPALLKDGIPIEDLRSNMDPGADTIPAPRLDLEHPPGLRSAYRLGHTGPTSTPFVVVSSADLTAEEGEVVSWSPLLGMACDESIAISPGGFVVMPLNAVELVGLEERDIARDFVNELRGQSSLETLDVRPHSCIALFGEGEYSLPDLERRRELSVAVLRLAGFSRFIDPALLGWFIYEGKMRTRIPTVYRQTIIRAMVKPAEESLAGGDQAKLDEISLLLESYEQDHRSAEVDRLLRQFLRGHGTRFLPKQAGAGLMFGVLEGILGRFRPTADKVQLEDLVEVAAAGAPEAKWFAEHGRQFRNAVAHRRWDPESHEAQLGTLTSVCSVVLRSLLEFHVAAGEDQLPGTGAFLRAMEARVRAG